MTTNARFPEDRTGRHLIQTLPVGKPLKQTKITTTATTATNHTLNAATTFVRIRIRSGDGVQFVYDDQANDAAVYDSRRDLELESGEVQDLVLPDNSVHNGYINYVTSSGNSTVILITEW